MAAPTYSTRALVLRKTKLGESDLILTLLAEDGSQLRVVAKGARKPSSSFSSRLELYSVVDLLCVKGKNLDIVKEARLVTGNEPLRLDMEHAAGAACMAELLERITQAGLTAPKMFDLTQVALASLCRVEAGQVPFIAAAHLLKALSFAGLKPSLEECVMCGDRVILDSNPGSMTRFSAAEGGVVCADCARLAQAALVPTATLSWAKVALGSTFAQLEVMQPDTQVGIDLLHLCQQGIKEHVGNSLKSLKFLFTSGVI